MKISRKIPQGFSVMIEILKAKYQYDIDKMKFYKGEIHDYLGMTLD